MEILNGTEWALVAPLIGLQLVLAIAALVNWSRQEETKGPKWMWFFLIVFFSIIGPILYFVAGRKDG